MENELMAAILTGVTTIVIALIGALTKRITTKLDTFLEEKGIQDKLKSKKYLVDIGVQATEQIWKNEQGAEKLERAKEVIQEMLRSEGLEIEDEQLRQFIEASVNAMKKGVAEGLAENDVVIVKEEDSE